MIKTYNCVNSEQQKNVNTTTKAASRLLFKYMRSPFSKSANSPRSGVEKKWLEINLYRPNGNL